MKKISALLTFGLLFHTSPESIIVNDYESSYLEQFDDEDDDFSIDTDLNNISLTNTHNLSMYRTPTSNAETISILLGAAGDAISILNNPIYQRTSPVLNRPILESPFSLTYGFDIKENSDLSLTLFLNTWSQKNYTKDSADLVSYFAVGNQKNAAYLQSFADVSGTDEDYALSFSEAVALFDSVKIQENRIGGILQSYVTHNKFNLIIQLPVLYSERNLFLTDTEKNAISNSTLGSLLQSNNVDANDFTYNHLVMDQFGIGDLKFKTMYELYQSDKLDVNLGGFIILPTATALQKGIIGTWFDQNNDRSYLDLTTIDPVSITKKNYSDINDFFLAAIDKLSSNVLHCPLGNNGHVVVAPSINTDWFFAENWQLSNDCSLQISLPTNEQRFYQKIQSEEDFFNSYDPLLQASGDSGADAIRLVDFVSQELQDFFFPYVFSTRVSPGTVFNSTNQFVYHYDAYDFYVGSNFWYNGAESLKIPEGDIQRPYTYDYAGVAASSAAQEKLFCRMNYNLDIANYSWSLSLYGDITIWNSGIGKDYTLGLSVDCKF